MGIPVFPKKERTFPMDRGDPDGRSGLPAASAPSIFTRGEEVQRQGGAGDHGPRSGRLLHGVEGLVEVEVHVTSPRAGDPGDSVHVRAVHE
jgi:hypothetical protein